MKEREKETVRERQRKGVKKRERERRGDEREWGREREGERWEGTATTGLQTFYSKKYHFVNQISFVILRKIIPKDESQTNDSSNIKKIDADFHFFSDTELTTNGNADLRSGSPINIESVLSDSEIEVKIRKGMFTGAKCRLNCEIMNQTVNFFLRWRHHRRHEKLGMGWFS